MGRASVRVGLCTSLVSALWSVSLAQSTVDDLDPAWADRFSSGEVQSVADLCTPGARIATMGGMPLFGQEGAQFFAHSLQDVGRTGVEASILRADVASGFAQCTAAYELLDADGQAVTSGEDVFPARLEDGVWRIELHMHHGLFPPEPHECNAPRCRTWRRASSW